MNTIKIFITTRSLCEPKFGYQMPHSGDSQSSTATCRLRVATGPFVSRWISLDLRIFLHLSFPVSQSSLKLIGIHHKSKSDFIIMKIINKWWSCLQFKRVSFLFFNLRGDTAVTNFKSVSHGVANGDVHSIKTQLVSHKKEKSIDSIV